jgi:O-antigen ligase
MVFKVIATKLRRPLAPLFRPEMLLPILIVTLPFERIPSYTVGVTVRPSMVVGVMLIIGTLARYRRNFFRPLGSFKLMAAFLFVYLLTALTAMHLSRALMVVGFTLYVILLAWAVAKTVRQENLSQLRRWLTLPTLVVCALAIYQFVGDLFGLPTWLTGLRPEYNHAAFGFPRVQAASLEPLYLANFLLLPLALELSYALAGRGRKKLLVLPYTVIFLTVSRGGAAAASIITLIVAVLGLVRRSVRTVAEITITFLLGLAIAYAAISVLAPYVGHYHPAKNPDQTVAVDRSGKAAGNFRQQAVNYDDSSSDRAKTRSIAFQLFLKHPLLGVGPGNFGFYAHTADPGLSERQTVNNLPLELLAESGLVATLILLIFFVRLAWQTIQRLRGGVQDWQAKAWQLGLLLFLAGTAIQYQTFSTLYITHIWVAIGLLYGLVANSRRTVNHG